MVNHLNPNASRWSSSNHIDRLRTWSIRSSVSCDNRVCVTLRPRKNVLYSNAETIAVKSLSKLDKPKNYFKNNVQISIFCINQTALTLVPNDRNHVNSIFLYHVTGKWYRCPKLPHLCIRWKICISCWWYFFYEKNEAIDMKITCM